MMKKYEKSISPYPYYRRAAQIYLSRLLGIEDLVDYVMTFVPWMDIRLYEIFEKDEKRGPCASIDVGFKMVVNGHTVTFYHAHRYGWVEPLKSKGRVLSLTKYHRASSFLGSCSICDAHERLYTFVFELLLYGAYLNPPELWDQCVMLCKACSESVTPYLSLSEDRISITEFL